MIDFAKVVRTCVCLHTPSGGCYIYATPRVFIGVIARSLPRSFVVSAVRPFGATATAAWLNFMTRVVYRAHRSAAAAAAESSVVRANAHEMVRAHMHAAATQQYVQ